MISLSPSEVVLMLSRSELQEKARLRVEKARTGFLEKHVPAWLERARRSHIFSMSTQDYCALAIACKGLVVNGQAIYTSGDASRAFGKILLPYIGAFYVYGHVCDGITYEMLQMEWERVFERGPSLSLPYPPAQRAA